MKNKNERLRFVIAAGIGAIVYYMTFGTGIYFLPLINLDPGDWYPIAVTAALVANTVSNFLLQKYWVFTNTNKEIWKGSLAYIIVSIIFIALNSTLVWVVVEWTKMYVWLASGLVAIVLIPPSFLVNRLVLRKKSRCTTQH